MGQINLNYNHYDWNNHDGINKNMINDFTRNQYYDRILRDNVRDRDCIDLGFGTGFLTLLALKHGARSVIGLESDYERFRLGLYMIKELGLEKKVKLYNTRYTHEMPTYVENAVIFSETVNGNLWQEGLWQSLPREPGQEFIPGQYILDVYAISVPKIYARGILFDDPSVNNFDTGVDLPLEYEKTLNEVLAKCTDTAPVTRSTNILTSGINPLTNRRNTPWGWIPWFRQMNINGRLVAHYHIDTATCEQTTDDSFGPQNGEINFDYPYINLMMDLNREQDPVILVPRVGLRHKDHTLYLDQGHWGPTEDPIIAYQAKQIWLSHNIHTGKISWSDRSPDEQSTDNTVTQDLIGTEISAKIDLGKPPETSVIDHTPNPQEIPSISEYDDRL